MNTVRTETIFDLSQMRDRAGVFLDRADAGHVLAAMLKNDRKNNSIVLAVPAGGVPVAKVIFPQRLG